MADNGSILETRAAGQLGAVGRTVTGLLLERELPVRAMVRPRGRPGGGVAGCWRHRSTTTWGYNALSVNVTCSGSVGNGEGVLPVR